MWMMESFKTIKEAPMLNPVVMPLPIFLAVIFGLGVAAYAYRRWLEDSPNPWAGQSWATLKPVRRTPGRHRLTRAKAADPHRRDWAALHVERLNITHRPPTLVVIPGGAADWRQPLTDFERRVGVMEVAGHDDHPMPDWRTADTHELAVAQ